MSVQSQKPRGILIAGNWKMNFGPRETERFLKDLKALSDKGLRPQDFKLLESTRLQACLIPPTLSLVAARHFAAQSPFPLHIAAQNAHWEKKGAFTGETSGPQLEEIGVRWALVGHSERRQFFGETDETARKRTESLLEQGLRVILCVGESLAEREAARTHEVLLRQLDGACPEAGKGIARFMNGKLVIAYEPVWAIGTGRTATPAQAEEAHGMIRAWLAGRWRPRRRRQNADPFTAEA